MPPDDAEQLFEALYTATYQQVLAYCRRRSPSAADADDAVSATYLVAWRRLDEVLAATHRLAWLYGVAYRTIANQYRSGKRTAALRTRLFGLPRQASPSPEFQVEGRGDVAAAFAALAGLSESDRELIRLAAFEELSHEEIAAATGRSVAAVKSGLFRARERLRAGFDEDRRTPSPPQEEAQ